MNYKPKLLLHVCCAPCSSACLSTLNDNFDITIFFYNPNISPFDEFQKRYEEEIKFVKAVYPHIKVVCGEYDYDKFIKISQGLENLPEGGERCKKCFELRLTETGNYAKHNKFDLFTTTLTISPHKNSKLLNEIGKNVANKVGVEYLVSDFKKNDGFQKSIDLSKRYGLYRQNYCGCEFSKKARELYMKNHNQII